MDKFRSLARIFTSPHAAIQNRNSTSSETLHDDYERGDAMYETQRHAVVEWKEDEDYDTRQITCSDDGAVCRILSGDPQAVDIIHSFFMPDLEVLVSGPLSYVCTDERRQYVLKLFKQRAPGADMPAIFRAERNALLATRGTENIIDMVQFYMNIQKAVYILIFPFAGLDAVELLNERRFSMTELESFSEALVQGVHTLMQLQMVHGDIKPENITFLRGTWRIIDLGFAYNAEELPAFVRGTLPYILPLLGARDGPTQFKDMLDAGTLSPHLPDQFATAMSILSMWGVAHEERNDGSVRVSVEDIYELLLPDMELRSTLRGYASPRIGFIIRTAAELALSQMDITKRYLTWTRIRSRPPTRCTFSGTNRHLCGPKRPVAERETNSRECWAALCRATRVNMA